MHEQAYNVNTKNTAIHDYKHKYKQKKQATKSIISNDALAEA